MTVIMDELALPVEAAKAGMRLVNTAFDGVIGELSQLVGAPDAALRLLISIFAGYPIVAIYRCCIADLRWKPWHHLYFTLCGLFLCIFNYGPDTFHSLIAIATTYVMVRLLAHRATLMLTLNFVFHMAYLLIGYYCTESDDYDILWTMPHCVLVLRLIGFGFDVADGRRPRAQLSEKQIAASVLDECPGLLEFMGFAYFPFSFLVGPQFPYLRYKRFIRGDFAPHTNTNTDCLAMGGRRFVVGMLYLAVRQVGAMYLPDDYFLTDAYRNESFVWRLICLGVWGKLSLYKYISCWLLVEGALICLGFTYNGQTADGRNDWSGCTNVKLLLLETGNTMQHYVLSFNVNTNHWVAEYVYKRLKFLNNRTVSYAAALGFLAVWHGFHSGYYMSFLIEYMIVTTEKQIEGVYTKAVLPAYGHILNESLVYKCLHFVVLKLYNLFYMGWCLTPFIFLSYTRWWRVFGAVNYFGFVYLAVWAAVYQAYQYQLRSAKRNRRENVDADATERTPLPAAAHKKVN